MNKQLANIFKRQFCIYKNAKIKAPPVSSLADLYDLDKNELPLTSIIKDEILDKGPITFNNYWQKALGHQEHGYYMKRDVFNTKGDFITSVEISQMFGEIIGIWVINLLGQIKAINLDHPIQGQVKEKQFSLLEFGPGKGTLMCDILKVLHQFDLLKGVEVNFIEMSPFLRRMQQELVQETLQQRGIYLKYDNYTEDEDIQTEIDQDFEETENQTMKVETFSNEDPDGHFITVRWFSTYEQMIKKDFGEYSITPQSRHKGKAAPFAIIAHEFFDALPTNIFQYAEGKGWREKLVNIAHGMSDKNFQFMLSEAQTEGVKKMLNPEKYFDKKSAQDVQDGDVIEIQPQSAVIANSISELISKVDGGALIIDYGENHAFSDSIRGIRKHKFIKQDDILEYPGEIDLSAYVNFQHLETSAKQVPDITTGGPIPQGLFLESMGMNARLEALSKVAKKKDAERLESEYYRLVAPEEMGGIYKCFYIGNKSNGEVFPFISPESNEAFY